jgi:hypothetical protein
VRNPNIPIGLVLVNSAIALSLSTVAISSAHATSSESNSLIGAKAPTQVEQNPPAIRMRVVRLVGKHKGYSVDVRYPQFAGGSRAAIRKINREIKLVVDRNISANPAPNGMDNYQYSCDFTKSSVTSRLVSLNFRFSSYLGGAGDEEAEVPLNARIFPQFKVLKLKDVLGKRVNYTELSRLYLKELQLDPEIDDLAPVYFSNFTFNENGLTVTLPQGQFSALGRGCPSATIAYNKLNSLIGKKSLIQEIVQTKVKGHSRR